jgi:hypothetical protein
MLYVTLSVSPLATVFEPPEKLAALIRTPPVAAVFPTVATPLPPETTMLPVIVADPMMLNEVAEADLLPAEAADQVIEMRLAMIEDVVSTTVGEA